MLRLFQFFWVWFGLGFCSKFRKSSDLGLVLVFETFFQFGFCFILTEPRKPFRKNFATFFSKFLSNFTKNIKMLSIKILLIKQQSKFLKILSSITVITWFFSILKTFDTCEYLRVWFRFKVWLGSGLNFYYWFWLGLGSTLGYLVGFGSKIENLSQH